MPRLFHRPPKYSRHRSTNQAVLYFQGERIYLGPYGSVQSHRAYQQFLKDWEGDRRHKEASRKKKGGALPSELRVASVTEDSLREKYKTGSPITLSELILVYRRYTHEYYRKRGEITREAGVIDEVLKFLRKYHAMTYLSDFGPVALRKLREAMVKDLDWSRRYINKQVNRIRSMFKWAAANELVEPTVSAALRELGGLKKGRSTARETAPIKPVSDELITATLIHLPRVVADMVKLQRLTSARPGEICSICPGNIDTSGDVWVYTPDEHKTEHFEKDRIIAIGPRAQMILRPYLTRDADAFCFSPQESEAKRRAEVSASRKTPYSCGNRPGTNCVGSAKRPPSLRYTTGSYRRAIHRVCDRHGLEKWSPNRLRHTASTEIRRRYGLEAARAVDGHSSASTTEIYAELDLQKAVGIMREVG